MLEPIKRVGFSPQDRQDVENMVIETVECDPEPFFRAYISDGRSFDGRYISADLFKELFPPFQASNESRNRYNAPVHNAAAVLAAEQFRRVVADRSDQRRDTVVFLTGIPGAGKTTAVLEAGEFPDSYQAVFEGQISRPAPTISKIQQVLNAGLKAQITVVHALSENAFANTLKRFKGYGRGASINVMADIQGNLPDGLLEVHRHFGDRVALHVIDKRDPVYPKWLIGWDNLSILRSEGNHEQIKQRLDAILEQQRPNLSDAAWRQAKGLAPAELVHERTMGAGHAEDIQTSERLHRRTANRTGEAPVLADVDANSELLAVQGSEREQQAAVEGASIEQAYQETLANYVMAKHEQAERVEARIEGLIERQEANLQQTQTNKPGVFSLPATKRAWQQKEMRQKARLHSLHQRLDAVREIKEGMGVFAPRVEEMATRRMRAEHPELASDWDAMREAGRRHQEYLRKQGKERKQEQHQGKGKKLSLHHQPPEF
jgi:dephospho-CoA kinase